jgi:DNA-binding HxlR family transcriptional regulator
MSKNAAEDAEKTSPSPGPERRYTLLDVFEVAKSLSPRPSRASDIALALDCSTKVANRRLRELAEKGHLGRLESGQAVVYWVPEGDGDSGDV